MQSRDKNCKIRAKRVKFAKFGCASKSMTSKMFQNFPEKEKAFFSEKNSRKNEIRTFPNTRMFGSL